MWLRLIFCTALYSSYHFLLLNGVSLVEDLAGMHNRRLCVWLNLTSLKGGKMLILFFLGGSGIGLAFVGFILIKGERYDKGVLALVAGGGLTLLSAIVAYTWG